MTNPTLYRRTAKTNAPWLCTFSQAFYDATSKTPRSGRQLLESVTSAGYFSRTGNQRATLQAGDAIAATYMVLLQRLGLVEEVLPILTAKAFAGAVAALRAEG
jgi:hypothetical protein